MIITIGNQKGGVGKTTTALAMASILGRKGYKVLLIDLDAQGNASLATGVTSENIPSIVDVMRNEIEIQNAILHFNEYDLLASSKALSTLQNQLMEEMGREYKLKEVLEPVKNKYDYIIIDTPPHLSILTVNAFTCSDKVIIPALADIFSLQGIGQVFVSIDGVKQYTNNKIQVAGVLLTRYSDRATLSKDVRDLIGKYSSSQNTKLYTTIRENIAVKESQLEQKSLCDYRRATAAKDYEVFIEEFLEG